MEEYLGPGSAATGSLLTFGAQYDLSISRLLYGSRYVGEGPDIVLSAFGMQTHVKSEDKTVDPRDGHSLYDGVTKRKLGLEASYSVLSWLGLSARYDQVWPDVSYTDTAFAQISPRLLFRSGWNARDQVALQYTRFIYGSQTVVRGGYPLRDIPTLVPDTSMIALTASLWW
jgi:hypothetical protein